MNYNDRMMKTRDERAGRYGRPTRREEPTKTRKPADARPSPKRTDEDRDR